MKAKNPFILYDYKKPKYFCHRKNELEKVFENIRAGKSTLILGKKDIGKTFLLKHINYLCKNQYHWSSIYLPIKLIDSVTELLSFIKNGELANNSQKKDFNSTEIKKKTRKLLILDDATLILEKDQERFLRVVNDFSAEGSTLFLVAADQKEIKDIEINTILLGEVPIEEQKEFIVNMFESKKIKITNKAVDHLIKLTEGNFTLTLKICSLAWDKYDSKIKPEKIDKLYEELLYYSTPAFDLILQVLSSYQVKLLKAIAIEGKANKITSQEFIKKYQLNAASSVKTGIYSLINKEIIIKNENNYSILNPLFGHWLKNLL